MAGKAAAEKQAWVTWTLEELSPIRFMGALLHKKAGVPGFSPMKRRDLADAIYAKDQSVPNSLIDQVLDTLSSIAPDWSGYSHLIGFYDQVWDMRELKFVDNELKFVYSSNIVPQRKGSSGYKAAWRFLLELSKGDEDLALDYTQAIAPLFMKRRPGGVIWFAGNGANGKSSLLNALYMILGRHFSSLSTAQIEDAKALPAMRGVLGNIVREGSETRVDDSSNYKSIGTHESLEVRGLYTQDMITVQADFHTIFNANNIPNFIDKTDGVRRRTWIVPFPARFKDDPTFEDRTFTPEFLGGLVTLITEAAQMLRQNNYAYKWSDATLKIKSSYDSDVNTAEAFLEHLKDLGVVGFYNYQNLMMNYQNWCGLTGLVPLLMPNLKRVFGDNAGAVRRTYREGGKVYNRYFLPTAPINDNLVWLENGYGLPSTKEDEEKKEQQKLELTKDKAREW